MNQIPLPTHENLLVQKLFAWCGPLAGLLWGVGFFGISGYLPLLSPASSANDIQAFYAAHPFMIEAGLCVTMMGAAFLGPFVVSISTQMRRIEGYHTPLADAQLGLGVLLIMLFIVPMFLLVTAGFRPERDPALIMLMNDAGWLFFVTVFQPPAIQFACIGLCILLHKRQTVFPRWLGFFNLWVAVLVLPAAGGMFLKTGPFAWDGVLCFWFVVMIFGAWIFIMFNEVRKAVNRQMAEAVSDSRG